jgi:hypothetical protein
VISSTALLVALTCIGTVYAKGGAYQSGFDHGVSDANDSCQHADGCHWYILQPGKGFTFHSSEFNHGYVDGFCSVDPHGGSDSDKASFDCHSR